MTSSPRLPGSRGGKIAGLLLALTLAVTLRAQSSVLGIVAPLERSSPVTLEVPAQVLTFQVSILSNTDDWEVRLSEVESARDVLRALAERQGFA